MPPHKLKPNRQYRRQNGCILARNPDITAKMPAFQPDAAGALRLNLPYCLYPGGMKSPHFKTVNLGRSCIRDDGGYVTSAALILGLASIGPVQAHSLVDALRTARDRSEQIASAEAEHDADEAGVVISKADGLPSVTTSFDYNENLIGESNGAGRMSLQGQANVPIYQGGAVLNSVKAARARSEASQVSLLTAEAELFSAVVTSYANVLRDHQIVGYSQENLATLTKTLNATRARFRFHDLTKTDLAQAQARAALARGELESALARLNASREEFSRLTNLPATQLEDLPILENLPFSAEEAAAAAVEGNPRVLAARWTRESRLHEVRSARGQTMPTLSAVVVGRQSDGRSLAFGQTAGRFGATVGLSLRWSIFQGGRAPARISQAAARETQAQLALLELERSLTAKARSDFSNWKAALAVVEASEEAVTAARQALIGVRAESDVGSRTILDILNAEQELRNAQVQVANAKRDGYLAAFSLLTTMGRTHSKMLSLREVSAQPEIGESDQAQIAGPLLDGPAPERPERAPAAESGELPALPAEATPAVAAVVPAGSAAKPEYVASAVSEKTREDSAPATARLGAPADWAVQLAAYKSLSAAMNNWTRIKGDISSAVGHMEPLFSKITVNGTAVYRLSIGRFSEFSQAEAACHGLRERDLQCIVRRHSTLGTAELIGTSKTASTDRAQ